MLSDDAAPPVDRPNLSKDYLAGTAQEDWLPLQPNDFYAESRIDLRLGVQAIALHPAEREIVLGGGAILPYDRLLLATGAEPLRLTIPGADLPHVHTLRTLFDCRAIIEGANCAKRVVIVGASFIGLEVAASLRTLGLEVHVVSPEAIPMERILGPDNGAARARRLAAVGTCLGRGAKNCAVHILERNAGRDVHIHEYHPGIDR